MSFEEVSSNKPQDIDQGEYTSWHCPKMSTDKESFTLDWRNDSNGYYDGTLLFLFNGVKYDGWKETIPEGWEIPGAE